MFSLGHPQTVRFLSSMNLRQKCNFEQNYKPERVRYRENIWSNNKTKCPGI